MDIIPDSEPPTLDLYPEAADEQDSDEEDDAGVLPQTSRRAGHKGKGRATIHEEETEEEDELLLAKSPEIPAPKELEDELEDDDDDDVPLATKSAAQGKKSGKNAKIATPVVSTVTMVLLICQTHFASRSKPKRQSLVLFHPR